MSVWRRIATLAWRSAAAELALIVAGVLIALAVDSWWEDRSDRERERTYLRQFLSEVQETEVRLHASIVDDSVALANVHRFLDAASAFHRAGDPAGAVPPPDSVQGWLGVTYAAFVPLTGTYTALLEDDGLRLLRNDSLRVQIVAYGAKLSWSLELLRLTEAQSWRNLERMTDAGWRNLLQPSGAKPWRDRLDARALLRDPEVLTTFTMQSTVGENRLGTLRELRAPVATLRRTLEAELKAR
jgi:hypothetical protein